MANTAAENEKTTTAVPEKATRRRFPMSYKLEILKRAQLLSEGRYLCPVRTMHRLREATGEAHERRDQLRHPVHAVPQLVATAPNQVWSWDIFSEAQFKTFKYRPDFPDRFGSLEDARAHCRDFFGWYNDEHHHSALGLLTPAGIHLGQADEISSARAAVLKLAFERHLERFPRGFPVPRRPAVEVWINRPPSTTVQPSRKRDDDTELVEIG